MDVVRWYGREASADAPVMILVCGAFPLMISVYKFWNVMLRFAFDDLFV